MDEGRFKILLELGLTNNPYLTEAEVDICVNIHQEYDRNAAMQKITYFTERKNFSDKIVVGYKQPNASQLSKYNIIKQTHDIISAVMQEANYMEVHTHCNVTGYFFLVKIGRKGGFVECSLLKSMILKK